MYYLLPVFAIACLVGLDRWTKYLCVAKMGLYEEIVVVPGVLRLFSTRNNGAAFGLFAGGRWVFLALTLAALGFLGYYYVTWPKGKGYRFSRVCLLMIAAGAIGNGVDRAISGEVVDFLDFMFVRFAVFNVADIFVTCGTAGLAAAYALGHLRKAR